jgi:hypothetical protein
LAGTRGRAADRALERALGRAEPDGAPLPFLLHPAPGLLNRHIKRCGPHVALIAEIQRLLASGTLTGQRAAAAAPLPAGHNRRRSPCRPTLSAGKVTLPAT